MVIVALNTTRPPIVAQTVIQSKLIDEISSQVFSRPIAEDHPIDFDLTATRPKAFDRSLFRRPYQAGYSDLESPRVVTHIKLSL